MTEIAGKGVFSCVVRAQRIVKEKETSHNEVAIKIMRTKFEVMRTSGLKEKEVLHPALFKQAYHVLTRR